MSRPRNHGTHAWAHAKRTLDLMDAEDIKRAELRADLEAFMARCLLWDSEGRALEEAQAAKAQEQQEHAPEALPQEGQAPLEPTGDAGSPPGRELCRHGVPFGDGCLDCEQRGPDMVPKNALTDIPDVLERRNGQKEAQDA